MSTATQATSAEPPAPPPPPQVIIIEENGDLTLRLHKIVDRDETFVPVNGSAPIPGRIVATLRVSRQVLIDNSEPLKAELTGAWLESHQSVIEMKVNTVKSVEIVMRVLHDKLTDECHDVEVKEVWEVIEYCNFRLLDRGLFEDWFVKVLGKVDFDDFDDYDMREWLLPCYVFDQAKEFALLTKRLAYGVAAHITERNPTNYSHLRLTTHIIGAINAAKGSLRNKLVRGICGPLGDFPKKSCNCRAEALLNYVNALTKTELWPLETQHKKPVQDILDCHGLVNFKAVIPKGVCSFCEDKLQGRSVKAVCDNVRHDFDGLCLDCINMTKTDNNHNVDDDYWVHDMLETWDTGCRITHGQSSWYWSFMGRRDEMKEHIMSKKKMKSGRGY